MTIDEALRELRLHCEVSKLRAHANLGPGGEVDIGKVYAKIHFEYLTKRDELILNWPDKVELITHPIRQQREFFLEMLKCLPERIKRHK